MIPDTSTTSSRKRNTPAQDKIREELNNTNSKIASYTKLQSTVGLSKELTVSLNKLRKEKDKLEKTLNKKVSDMKSQAKLRDKKANVIKQLQKEHPAAASTLKKLQVNQGQIGRPSLEKKMLGLHEAILR